MSVVQMICESCECLNCTKDCCPLYLHDSVISDNDRIELEENINAIEDSNLDEYITNTEESRRITEYLEDSMNQD